MNDVLELKNLKTDADCRSRLASVRQELAEAKAWNDKLLERIGTQAEIADRIAGAVKASRPYPRFRYAKAKRTGLCVVPVLKLSDWHIGEVTDASETEGFGRYNWDIAQRGLLRMVEDFLQWVEIQRAHFVINEARVFCEGDYISGDIHDELRVTNEFPIPVQTAKAGGLLGEVFRILCAHFKTVVAEEVGAGNHDRLVKKPQAKQRTTNSMSYLVHHIANTVAAPCKNLVIHTAEGAKHVANVNGTQFLIEHGDNVKGWAGHPYYGFERLLGRESKRRMGTDKHFRYWSIGHWHVPGIINDTTLVNGALNGTSTFDHLNGRHAEPAQVAFLVHPNPKYGIFNHTAFRRKV